MVNRCCLMHGPKVFAQATGWREMGNRFRQEGTTFDAVTGLWLLVAAIVFILALWLLSKYVQYDGQRPYYSRWRLFVQLCHAHRLSWRQRWMLWRLARSQRLPQPALLFVEPERLTRAHVPPRFEKYQSQLDALHRRLFQQAPDATERNASHSDGADAFA